MLGSKPRALCTLGKVFHWAHESFSLLPSTGSRCCLRILLHTPPHSSAKQGSELVLCVNSHSSCQSHWWGFIQPSINFHISPFDFATLSLPGFHDCRDYRPSERNVFKAFKGWSQKRLQRSSGQKSRKRAGLKWEGSEDKGRQAQTTAKPSTIIITQEYT